MARNNLSEVPNVWMAHSLTGPGVRSMTADPTALSASACGPNGAATSSVIPTATAAAAMPFRARLVMPSTYAAANRHTHDDVARRILDWRLSQVHACSVARTSVLSRRSVVREYLHGAYWVLPALGIALGLGAGALLSTIPVESGSFIDKMLFQGTAGDARGVLTVVSATMITTTGIVFSLTVLSLQIASSQFSVRLLRTFLRDIPNQVVLAIFVCTFAYSTGGLHTVGEHEGGGEFVPKVAVTGSLALAFVSIGALIYFLHHLVHSIQIDTIIENVQTSTLDLVDELFPVPCAHDAAPANQPEPPAGAVPLLAPKSGYIQTVDVDEIAEIAAATEHSVQLVTFVGDYETAGGFLGWYWRRGPAAAPNPDVMQRVLRHVHIGFERTLQQDIRFGLRQMVDIALRALSPAVNDPYTGVQVVHHVSAIESVLASRMLTDDVRRDRSGDVLVWLRYPSFETYLHVGCAQIRRYGSREPLVLAAILQMLSAVAQNCTSESRRAAVQAEIDLVARAAERELAEESDRAMVARAAAGATEVVRRPGTLAPSPSTFGMAAAAAAAASVMRAAR
jgi:uncharacterized membrane protein